MDFHGFVRKELQALCKQNKIPANMTNVAMADALSSLDHVEGLEEILKQRGLENVENGSPEIARTATRTLTRARKNVLESGGVVLSRSRVRASRQVRDADLDVNEDEAVKTPAVPRMGRRGAGAASSRRKVEVPSVQRVYSTRRSVRLVEKQFSELCLGDSVRKSRPIKIDDELSSEMSCTNAKGDEIKMELPVECTDKALVKDEVSSCQVSNETVDAVEALNVATIEEVKTGYCAVDNAVKEMVNIFPNNGIGDVAHIEEVVKSIPEDSDRDGAMDKAEADSTGIADLVTIEEVVKSISEDSEKDGAMDKAEADSSGIADLVTIAEVEKSENCANDNEVIFAGKGNSSMADVAAIGVEKAAVIEEVVKSISEDLAKDGAMDKAEAESIGMGADLATIEEVEKVTDYANDNEGVIDDEKGSPDMADVAAVVVEKAAISNEHALITEADIGMADVAHNVVVENVHTVDGHGLPSLPIEKKDEFKFAGTDYEHDLGVKLEASIKTTSDNVPADLEADIVLADNEADNVLADNEADNVPADNEADKHDAGLPSLAVWEAKVTTPVIELPPAAEDVNKENIADILKTEDGISKPKTPFEKMSKRRLLKMFKELTINDKETEGIADKIIVKQQQQQQHAVTPRKALQTITNSSQKQ